jgi:polysaccharide export outer membrane protein
MRKVSLASGVALALFSLATAAQRLSSPQPAPSFPAVPATIGGSNLPFQPIGASDLVHITVNDSPELSQTFRVDKEGNLNLPLLHHPIPAVGLMPDVLRDDIAAALKAQHLLVNPVVDVSVVEYRSREVTVAGAVKTPIVIQEFGNLRLLAALSQAGGLLPEASPEIIVEHASGNSQRISVRELFDGYHPALNISLEAGASSITRSTRPRCAPSAIRIPISPVRWVTG